VPRPAGAGAGRLCQAAGTRFAGHVFRHCQPADRERDGGRQQYELGEYGRVFRSQPAAHGRYDGRGRRCGAGKVSGMTVIAAGKFGTPFHGEISDDGAGLVVHLQNETTIPYPYAISTTHTPIKLIAPDAPAAPETTPAETALGRMWRNYLLYQYGMNDLYHSSQIGGSIAQGAIIAHWLYLPAFGEAYNIYFCESVEGNDYTYSLVANKRDGILRTTILQHTYAGRSLALSDVADGDGSKALFLLTPPGQVGVFSGCEEWALTYTALTGEVTAVRNSLAEVDAAGTGGSSSSGVYNKYSVLQNEIIAEGVCGPLNEPYTLRRYYREVFDDTLDPVYTNRSSSAVNEVIVSALYIAGAASVVSLYTSASESMTWTVSLTHVYEAHEEIGGDCGITLVEDVADSRASSMSITYSSTYLQELRINGGAVFTHPGSASFNETIDTTVRDNFYDAAELVGGDSSVLAYTGAAGWWMYFEPFTSGDDHIRPKKSPGTVNGASAEFTYRPAGTITYAAAIGSLEYFLRRSVHPVLYINNSGSAISPAGMQAVTYDPDSSDKLNYNPAEDEVVVGASNFSWV